MSEKLYACLLQLFPPAFRKQYQQEALRLLRDRLRDEKGFLRRLRLGLDLLSDLIRALPQAYRNSYPQAIPSSPAPHFEGGPSFQVLKKEPVRRGVVLIGGLVSVTTLAAFIYVMQGPVALHPAERKGHKSPIELVMEHLNQPLTADPADKALSTAVRSEPTASRDQTANAIDQDVDRAKSGPAPSRAVATSSALAQIVLPTPIRVQVRSADGFTPDAPAPVLESVSAGSTGCWRAMDGDADLPTWLSLKQDGAKVSGTGGLNPSAQFPVLDGVVTGHRISFGLHAGQRTFHYDLKFQDQELRGTASVTTANGTRTASVRFERVR